MCWYNEQNTALQAKQHVCRPVRLSGPQRQDAGWSVGAEGHVPPSGSCRVSHITFSTVDRSMTELNSTWNSYQTPRLLSQNKEPSENPSPPSSGFLHAVSWLSRSFLAPDRNTGIRAQRSHCHRVHFPVGQCLTGVVLWNPKPQGVCWHGMHETLAVCLGLGIRFSKILCI